MVNRHALPTKYLKVKSHGLPAIRTELDSMYILVEMIPMKYCFTD